MSYARLISRSRIHNLALVAALLTAFRMTPLSLACGLAVFGLGFLLQLWSKAVLRRDKELGTRGPYALCRHPFYLANGLMDLGLCAMAGFWPVIVLYPVLFLLAYIPTARHEESVLASLFPDSQAAYLQNTPRFFPTTGRIFREWRSPLSRTVLLNERQLSRSLRHASFPLLVILAAQAWKSPLAWQSLLSHAAGSGAVGLLLLGFVIYGKWEGGSKHRGLRSFANGVSRGAPFILAVLVLLAGFASHPSSLHPALTIAALILVVGLAGQELVRRVKPAFIVAAIAWTGLASVSAASLLFTRAAWLIPLTLSLATGWILLQDESTPAPDSESLPTPDPVAD